MLNIYNWETYKIINNTGEQDGGGVGGHGVHLSTDTSGMHLQTQKCMQKISWEWTEVPDQWKIIYRTMQNLVGWGTRGKNRSVNRTGPALSRWGNWSRALIPTARQLSEVKGETFKAESETADLWQPKWNENHTVLSTAVHTLDRNAGLLESTVAGSWSSGIMEQSQGKGCYWLWRDGLRGCEGGDCGGKCQWRKARQPWKQGDTAESRVGGGAITEASLPIPISIGSWTIERLAHQMPDALNYRVGPYPECTFQWLMHWSIE